MPLRARLLDAVDRLDVGVDHVVDRVRGNPVADRVFYTASELGDFSLLWHILGVTKGLGPAGPRVTLRLATALGAESALVNGAVKSLFGRGRPVHDEARPHRLRQPRTSSFPSGHASSAFLAAGLLSEGSRLTPVYYTLAVIVAGSRIYVRIHHASDVIAGAALGVGLAVAVKRRWPLR